MLNFIWPIFIISSFVYGILNGKVSEMNNSIFDSTKAAIELSISLLGTICLWNGIMQIACETKIVKFLAKIINPVLKNIFPNLKKEDEAHEQITMNIIANIMGLGNAATPLGLKAMKTMQKNNKDKKRLSDSMVMFIVLNTASIQLIPTTVIAIRNSLGSKNPTAMIIPVWVATACAAFAAIISAKILIKKF